MNPHTAHLRRRFDCQYPLLRYISTSLRRPAKRSPPAKCLPSSATPMPQGQSQGLQSPSRDCTQTTCSTRFPVPFPQPQTGRKESTCGRIWIRCAAAVLVWCECGCQFGPGTYRLPELEALLDTMDPQWRHTSASTRIAYVYTGRERPRGAIGDCTAMMRSVGSVDVGGRGRTGDGFKIGLEYPSRGLIGTRGTYTLPPIHTHTLHRTNRSSPPSTRPSGYLPRWV
jgi:hypothetical protein